jgi:hypothetical protein
LTQPIRLVVPISYFIEKSFQNWTRVSADLLGTVYLYCDYSLPVQAVREKLIDFIQREFPESLPRFRAEFGEKPEVS